MIQPKHMLYDKKGYDMRPGETKEIKIDDIKIRYNKYDRRVYLHINFGRYKKKNLDRINSWTIFDAISNLPKSKYWDDIILDIDEKEQRIIGLTIKLWGEKSGYRQTRNVKKRSRGVSKGKNSKEV